MSVKRTRVETGASPLFQYVPSPILYLDSSYTVLEMNPALVSLIGVGAKVKMSQPNGVKLTLPELNIDPEKEKSWGETAVHVEGDVSVYGLPTFQQSTRLRYDYQRDDYTNYVITFQPVVVDLARGSAIEDTEVDLLRTSERRLRMAQTLGQLGMWDWNVVTGDLHWSDSIAPLFGYPKGDLETSYENFIKAVHPDDRNLVTTAVDRALADPGYHYDIEHRIVWPDGSVHYVRENGGVVRGADGKPVSMLGVVTDIDHRIDIERQLRSAADAKTDFLLSVSHELRTPLNAIMGYCAILRAEDPTSTGLIEIDTATKHLLELINQTLDLSTLAQGKTPLTIQSVDVDALVRECCTLLSPSAKAANITLQVETASPSHVSADRLKLKQIILNLVSNACKYAGPTSTVRFTTEVGANPTESLVLIIADDGKGVEKEAFTTLFEPFSRFSDDQTTTPGSGLGLAISRELVQVMNGEMLATPSKPDGTGLRFSITLPMCHNPSTAPSGGMADLTTQATQIEYLTRLQQKYADSIRHILIVEDTPILVRLMRTALRKFLPPTWGVAFATNADAAIQQAKSVTPNLIFMDMRLPGEKDGVQCTRELRAMPQFSETPIFAVTANNVEAAREAAEDAGFTSFFTKPVDILELIKHAYQALGCEL